MAQPFEPPVPPGSGPTSLASQARSGSHGVETLQGLSPTSRGSAEARRTGQRRAFPAQPAMAPNLEKIHALKGSERLFAIKFPCCFSSLFTYFVLLSTLSASSSTLRHSPAYEIFPPQAPSWVSTAILSQQGPVQASNETSEPCFPASTLKNDLETPSAEPFCRHFTNVEPKDGRAPPGGAYSKPTEAGHLGAMPAPCCHILPKSALG